MIIRQVLKYENVEHFDLVYVTQNNSEEDLNYYSTLSLLADTSQYLYVKPQLFDIVNQIKIYALISREYKERKYIKVIFSSIDNLAFRKIINSNNNANVITIDDGTANINRYSSYIISHYKIKSCLYRFMFGVGDKTSVMNKVVRHYSIYRDLINIMPNHIIRYIDLFNRSKNQLIGVKKIKFFIGQPIDKNRDTNYILKVKTYILENNFDFYVMHPRETIPLVNKIPFLKKHGKIVEEAILSICKDSRPIIVGNFTSVLFNISADYADKIMILSQNDAKSQYYAELGKRVGCKIIYI